MLEKKITEYCFDKDHPKYVLDPSETVVEEGVTLSIIRYRNGQTGGFAESYANLSQEGGCRIEGNARVFGNARVEGNAIVRGNAKVGGYATVGGNACVEQNAYVSGCAQILDNAKATGNCKILGSSILYECACATGWARVEGQSYLGATSIIHADQPPMSLADQLFFHENEDEVFANDEDF